MREVVYLSEGKIRQFLPKHGQTWSLSHLSVRSPVIGVDVDRTDAPSQRQLASQLRQVEKHIAKSAVPYTAPGAWMPGMWVEFRTPLSYITVEQERFGSMVLFVQPATMAVPVPWGRRVRLLLHGSAHHLLGRSPRQLDYDVSGNSKVEEYRSNGSDSESFSLLVSNAEMLSNALGQHRVDQRGNRVSEKSATIPGHYFDASMGNFMIAVDGHIDPGDAAWMAGYARVTRFVKHYPTRLNYLVATPLYVMYSTPPPAMVSHADLTRWPALEDVEPIEWPEE